MIGLDTNILLRLFRSDDPIQSARAKRYVGQINETEKAAVGPIVLSEFAWTLRRQFKLPKADVIELLGELLSTDDLEIFHRNAAIQALDAYRSGKADFPDYFLAYMNLDFGCASTATFDRDALDDPTFTPVP